MEYTDNTEPCDLYRKWVIVSVIAACMQRKIWLDWGDERHYANMYIVLVGASGRCRKSTAMRPGKALLRNIGIELTADCGSWERLIQRMAEATKSFMLDDGNLTNHCSMTAFASELMVFLDTNNEKMVKGLTDWWDCEEHWSYETKNKGNDYISGLWFNIVGATTPSLVREQLPTSAIGGGLTSRIIFVFAADKGKIVPLPFTTEEQEIAAGQIEQDLNDIFQTSGGFTIDEEFANAYVKWYTHVSTHPPNMGQQLDPYVDRRATHLKKLAMILCIARSNQLHLEKQDFDAALTMLLEAEKGMGRVFEGMGKHGDILMQMRTFMEERKGRSVTYEELVDRFQYDILAKEIYIYMDGLKKAGHVTGGMASNGEFSWKYKDKFGKTNTD